LGKKVTVIIADLADSSAVGSIISQITSSQDFEILVNVAGIQRRIAAESFPQDVYNEVMQVNLGATFTLCRDAGKYWIEKGIKGRIINTASLATFQGGINMAAYSASKGAVGQLTKALSNEWAGKGINVNAIAPG
jgi:2-deoxy-D-gluconate 3-dehydrogenase